MSRIAELDAYFKRIARGQYSDHYFIEVNLLSRNNAREVTGRFSYHPTIKAVGGFILDDPETSDHHVFATKSPVAGQILYLSHDGNTRVMFPSLLTFLDAVEQALEQQCLLSDLHPILSPLCEDQSGLGHFIEMLCKDVSGVDVAVQLMPSLDFSDIELLERLAAQDNFFLLEAIAFEISKRPRSNLLHIAEKCSTHRHPQVAIAGAAAAAAIRGI